jgi:hypothetical protein
MSTNKHKAKRVPIGGKEDFIVEFLLVERRNNNNRANTHQRFLCIKDLLDNVGNGMFGGLAGMDFIRKFGLFDSSQNELLEQCDRSVVDVLTVEDSLW